MVTIKLIDDGFDRYTLVSDSYVLGRMYDHCAEEIIIEKPEVEQNSVCTMIVKTIDGEILDYIAVGNAPISPTNFLSQNKVVQLGFSFERQDHSVKNSEYKRFEFLKAFEPYGTVPVSPEQEQNINFLIGNGFVNAEYEDNKLKFENINGEIVDEVEIDIDLSDYYIKTEVDEKNSETLAESKEYTNEKVEEIKNNPDVVDIVQTKADLLAYDTSTLGNNDIIRVLVDESQSGKSSFYQWHTLTQSWTLKGTIDVAVDLNIENGEGQDSIVLKYTGDVDSTHFGNTNTGESATVLGEANSNTANRVLMAGKLNRNKAPNSIIAGLGNGRGIVATPGINEITGSSLIVSGEDNRVYNVMKSIITGYGNTVQDTTQTITAGYNNLNIGESSIVAGNNNACRSHKSLVVGNGNNIAELEKAGKNIIGGDSNVIRYAFDSIISGTQNDVNGLISGIVVGQDIKVNTTYYPPRGRAFFGKLNDEKSDTLLEVGNGTDEQHRSNAFEVLTDGRAKVYGAPTESNDVVRQQELDNKVQKETRSGYRVYVHTPNGDDTVLYATGAVANDIPQRTTNGNIIGPERSKITEANYYATKDYIDSMFYKVYTTTVMNTSTLPSIQVPQLTAEQIGAIQTAISQGKEVTIDASYNGITNQFKVLESDHDGDVGGIRFTYYNNYLDYELDGNNVVATYTAIGGGSSGGTKLYMHNIVIGSSPMDMGYVSIISSDSNAYNILTAELAEKISATFIRAYFVSQYGEVVITAFYDNNSLRFEIGNESTVSYTIGTNIRFDGVTEL